MGPSRAGKNSVLDRARTMLSVEVPVAFAHRYITRPADVGGENHIALSRAERCAAPVATTFDMEAPLDEHRIIVHSEEGVPKVNCAARDTMWSGCINFEQVEFNR